jgi:multiple antibiotic resistance protein
MTYDALLNAFVTFFVTIDPPGQVGIFLALTTGMTSAQRRQTALRGTIIGILILLIFMLVGGVVLSWLMTALGTIEDVHRLSNLVKELPESPNRGH